MRTNIFILAALFTISSCTSIDKLVEKGKYNDAFTLAVKKLSGESHKKTKYVIGLEKAYAALNARDEKTIKDLNASNNISRYERIYNIYNEMDARKNSVAALLPLVSVDGRRGRFTLIDNSAEKNAAKENAIISYYDAATTIMNASNNTKYDYRRAYDYLNSIYLFTDEYKDTRSLIVDAKRLGTTFIAIDVDDANSRGYYNVFADKINAINLDRLNTKWEKYLLCDYDKSYDKYVVVRMDNIDMGRESENVNNYEMATLVDDGIDLVRDSKGAIMKDTSGREITIPRKTTVKAWVSEIYREKHSTASARIMVYDELKSLPISTTPLAVHHDFKDAAIKYTGDRRAIDNRFNGRMDNHINNFPSDFETLDELSSSMVYAVENAVKRLSCLPAAAVELFACGSC
jgi:hypothetical protein